MSDPRRLVAAADDVAASQRVVEELLAALPDDEQRFAVRSATIGDWDGVVAAARDQGVLGLLLHYWRAASVGVPVDVLERATRHVAVEQLWLEQVQAAGRQALDAMERRRVACAALKGPVLAERLYPSTELRPCIDFDLLVAPRDLDSASDTLRSLGYEGEAGPAADYARRHTHHLHFRRAGTPDIELHFRLYAGFGTVLAAEDALARSIEHLTADGATVRVLAPEDELLYLALHAAGHSYVRLLWLYDLKLLLRASPGIDWRMVESRARAHGVEGVLAFTFELLADRLDAGDATSHRLPRGSGLRSRAARRLLPVVMKPTARSSRENLESLVFTSLLCDRWVTGLGMLRHHAARAARRRLHRLAPRLVPASWGA